MSRSRLGWWGTTAGLLAAFALLAPWARSGDTDRSSIELLGSAGVLEVISGWQRPAAVLAWYLVVVLAAAALVAVAWQRPIVAAWALLPIGPAMLAAAVIVARSSLPVRWGAVAGVLAGLMATTGAILILMTHESRGKGTAE